MQRSELKKRLWRLIADEEIIVTNDNIDWLLERVYKEKEAERNDVNEKVMRNTLKQIISESSDKVLSIPYISEDGAEALADHLISEGVIVLPIPYGTKLYFLRSREHADKPQPPCIHITDDWILKIRNDGKKWFSSNDIPVGYFGEYLHQLGNTVFLTLEEAERALERSKECHE